jgi:hypothetical protein
VRAARAVAALALLAACDEAPTDARSFVLPSSLKEVSGLAAAGPNSVFAHSDEHAIVQEIDVRTGKVERAFAFGVPTIEGDFEGIAVAAGKVFLLTSDGLIYAAEPGADGDRVGYSVYDTGVGPRCEVEGLSAAPEPDHLLLLCKRMRIETGVPLLEIHRWKVGTQHAETEPWLSLPLADFLDQEEAAEFGPSALDWDPENERFLIVSARGRMLIQLSADGRFLAKRRLDPQRHRQAEGIALLPGCRMVLADEGNEMRQARLAVYPCPPASGG